MIRALFPLHLLAGVAACSEGQPEDINAVANAEINQALHDPEYQRSLRLDGAMGAPIRIPAELLDQIEARLAENSCVGSMAKWERRYTLGIDHARGYLDTKTIWFSLHEAGKYEFRTSRKVMSSRDWGALQDDRPYIQAYGVYHIPSRTLELRSCGPNVGG